MLAICFAGACFWWLTKIADLAARYACMYVCMYVCTFVCIYVCADGCTDGCTDGWMFFDFKHAICTNHPSTYLSLLMRVAPKGCIPTCSSSLVRASPDRASTPCQTQSLVRLHASPRLCDQHTRLASFPVVGLGSSPTSRSLPLSHLVPF